MERDPSGMQLFLLFAAVFIDLLGFGIIIPNLPFLVREFTPLDSPVSAEIHYTLIVAVFSLMQFIFAPIWGAVSDRVGRKPVIVIGLGGSVIGFGIFGLATDLSFLYLSRTIAGIFTAATLTVANAYIADVSPPEKRGANFGLIAAAFGLGFAIGPGIGGLLGSLSFANLEGYQLAAFFASLLSLLNMLAAIPFLPESLIDRKEGWDIRLPILQTASLKEYGNVLWYILIFALVGLGFSNFIAVFPLYAVDLSQIGELELGYYFTYAGLIIFFTQTVLIRPLLRKFGEEIVLKTGVFLIGLGFFTLTLAPTFWWFFLTNIPLLFGISFVNPSSTSLISRSTPRHRQGEVLGIQQGWSSFSRILGPLFATGLLLVTIPRYIFYLNSLLFLIIFLIAWKVTGISQIPETAVLICK